MGQNSWDKFFFVPTLAEFDFERYADYVLHIFCIQGSMELTIRNVSYRIVPGDYVILPCISLLTRYSESSDFCSFVMGLSREFAISFSIRSDYDIVGYLSLLENPVMKLSEGEFARCCTDLERLRLRLSDSESHLFREGMLGSLLAAHIFDLYDIHARGHCQKQISERGIDLLRRFVELLSRGDYCCYRDLDYYAACLCITPQHLSRICRQASGHPASYWIDHFVFREAIRLLNRKELSFSEIAERLKFSSLSHFNRYFQRQTGLSPTEYRINLYTGRGKRQADR